MRILVTCGPGYEPIDQVRRITNFSTGELGLMLSSAMAGAGYPTICLKGEAATSGLWHGQSTLITFSTNDDLVEKLRGLPVAFDFVFHAAALSDFRVTEVCDGNGVNLRDGKLPSSISKIKLTLEPATKVLALLPSIFPDAKIVGWKYEVDGSRGDALAKARAQIQQHHLCASIVNGPAWGAGFGVVRGDHPPVEIESKQALCNFFLNWIHDPAFAHASDKAGT